MSELFEGVLKVLWTLFRVLIEGGVNFGNLSLSGTGRFIIRLLYPPHWCQPDTHYPLLLERVVGLCVWIMLLYGIFLICQIALAE